MADSRKSCGGMPVASISGCWVSCQLSFTAIGEPVGPKRRRSGSLTAFGTLNFVSEGPMPRMMTRLASLPVMMKPPIINPSPASTRRRVEILTGCVAGLGEGDGLVLGLGEGLGLGDVPGLGDGLALGDGLGLGEGLALPITLIVALALLRASSIWNVPKTQKVNE